MGDFTPHQKKIINRYYEHRDDIALTRLGEIVTELYLAASEAKAKQLWKRAATALTALGVAKLVIDRVVAQGKVEVLAEHLRDLQGKRK